MSNTAVKFFTFGFVLITLCACAYLGGYRVACNSYEAKLELFKTQAEAEKLQAIAEVKQKELEQYQLVSKAYEQEVKNKHDIQKRFDNYVSQLSVDRVYDNKSDSADRTSVSDNTCSTAGAKSGSANGSHGKTFRDLKQDVLAVGRDCDITASHYNQLLKLWNSLSTAP